MLDCLSLNSLNSLNSLDIIMEDLLPRRGDYRWDGRTHNDSAFYMQLISTRGDETIANIAIVLLKQLDYLLYKQLQRLSQEFIDNGGFKERMSQCRRNKRGY